MKTVYFKFMIKKIILFSEPQLNKSADLTSIPSFFQFRYIVAIQCIGHTVRFFLLHRDYPQDQARETFVSYACKLVSYLRLFAPTLQCIPLPLLLARFWTICEVRTN